MDRYVFKTRDERMVNLKPQLCSLQQSTGLSDLNDMPIFEGDILSDISGRILYEVVWDSEGAKFVLSNLYQTSDVICRPASDIPKMAWFE